MSTPIVELKAVGKSFSSADGSPRTVLDGVDFTLRERDSMKQERIKIGDVKLFIEKSLL